jgi:hypothetical protein
MSIQKHEIKIGDRVTFDNDQINLFVAETTSVSPEVSEYQRLVLAGVDQVGTVQEITMNMTTVYFSDGWVLPIPTKYLVVLPEVE